MDLVDSTHYFCLGILGAKSSFIGHEKVVGNDNKMRRKGSHHITKRRIIDH